MSQSSQLACPKCGQIDQVQKVSAVVSGGVSTETRMVYGVAYHDSKGNPVYGGAEVPQTRRTVLSQRLLPPEPPAYKDKRASDRAAAIFLLLIGLGIVAVGATALIVGITVSIEAATRHLVNPNDAQYIWAWYAAGIPILAFGGFFAIAGGRLERTLQGKNESEYNTQRSKWAQAMRKWEQLYYYNRDDGVYIPGQSEFVPVGQMTEFLYRT